MKKIQRRNHHESIIGWPSGYPKLLERIFSARNIQSLDDLKFDLPSLLSHKHFLNIDLATKRLVQAVVNDESILIVGDFDCDGATSTALAVHALRAMGATQVNFIVPNRFEYGYGLTPEIIEVSLEYKPSLIITVDNGISSFEGVDCANSHGIDVVITDHHLSGKRLPAAHAIINPNQSGGTFPSKCLAGVGVIFYLMLALRAALKKLNWFSEAHIPCPNMGEYLDLVALGTVADVVMLDKNNRILVYQGLQRMRSGTLRPGIRALIEISKRNIQCIRAADLGFALGPRLNAAGRISDMSLGIRCLLSDNLLEARVLAKELDELNQERRAIEQTMQAQAQDVLDGLSFEGDLPKALCLFNSAWHQGVVGLLASRIKEKYYRPVFVFSQTKTGALKGSGRSIPGVHIRDVLDRIDAQSPGLLLKFGGHAMAAGLSIESTSLELFRQLLIKEVAACIGQSDLTPYLETDGNLAPEDFSLEVATSLRDAAPWGQGFPEPAFDGEFDVVEQYVVAKEHLKMVLKLPSSDCLLHAIKFHADPGWLSDSVSRIKAVFRMEVNRFQGRDSVQLLIEDMAPVLEA